MPNHETWLDVYAVHFQDGTFETRWDMNAWTSKWICEKMFKFLPACWPSTKGHKQSDTKPNLVAKILGTKLLTICA